MSWLIRMTFGVAAHFVLENGWLVTNFFGLIVLLSIYVMAHVTAALMSFQMISLVPHHLPKLIGFSSANRVDMDEFSKAAAWVGTRGALSEVDNSTRASLSRQSPNNLVGSPSRPSLSAPPKALTGPAKGLLEQRDRECRFYSECFDGYVSTALFLIGELRWPTMTTAAVEPAESFGTKWAARRELHPCAETRKSRRPDTGTPASVLSILKTIRFS